MNFPEFFHQQYFGNLVSDYLLALLYLAIGLIFHGLISNLVIRLLSQMFRRSPFKLKFEDYKKHLRKPLNFLLFLIFIFLASSHLEFPEYWNLAPIEDFGLRKIILKIYQILIAIALTRVGVKLIVVFGEILQKKAETTVSKQDDQLIPFGTEIVKVLIIILAALIAASTIFDLNVASLVAGLGIGGLAVALAAQESLENLFGSFTIFLDKPFVVGDLVKVGDVEGVIERVGFRSTRIRTLEKSYLTIPNKKMIDAELDNLSLRTFRRVKFNLGILYGTKAEVIKEIVKEIKEFLDEYPHTNEDSVVRFFEFGESSLNIRVLYFVDTMDYNLYMEYKEVINFKIMEIVQAKGSDFAFPTRTIHVQNQNS